MFKLKDIISNSNTLNLLKCYPGMDFNKFLLSNKLDERVVYIDIKKDFLTFDHFYKFTLVKVFNRFINSNKKIFTTGQLLFYLKKISFDKTIINTLELIVDDYSLTKSEKFLMAWKSILRLCEIINVKLLFLDNLDEWWEGRRNFKKDLDKCFDSLIDEIKNIRIKTIFITSSTKKLFLQDNMKEINLYFDDLLTESEKSDNRYNDLYEEYDLYRSGKNYDDLKKDLEIKIEDYIKSCRGEKQVRYILYIIALTNNSGMTISDIAKIMEVSPGAAGSSLNRMLTSGLLRRINKKYYIKNNYFSRFILEN